jgi:hypothetical protein
LEEYVAVAVAVLLLVCVSAAVSVMRVCGRMIDATRALYIFGSLPAVAVAL